MIPDTKPTHQFVFRIFGLLVPVLFSVLSIRAEYIDRNEAMAIAESFLGKKVTPASVPQRISGRTVKVQAIHILNAEDGNGFVIVSGDDRTLPILAYSDQGVIAPDNVPGGVIWLIEEYQKIIESTGTDAQLETDKKPSPITMHKTSAKPLLTTQWNQYSPFNNECPSSGNERYLTGCVATAMAQVINYEKKKSSVPSIPAYTTDKGIEVDALQPRTFNFGELNEADIAHLMRYCGQSVRMNYGLTESGAYSDDIPDALRNYFGWENEVRTMYRDDYNEEHWNRIVTEEVEAGHPLIYSAISEAGSGHTFVVDGIADSYFHVNWGWGGSADGYYTFAPYSSDNRSEYILRQSIVSTRTDSPSKDIITFGTTINGINYTLQDDLTAAVLPLKNGEKYKGDLVIPSTVKHNGKTYTVNYLSQGAFVNCREMTSISIPSTITGQDWSIFTGCEKLHKVYITDLISFLNLDIGAWNDGSPMCYGADLYLNGKLVKDLVIPEGVESIGYSKFTNCTSIETVTFPSTMKKIGQASFAGCQNLRKVDMLNSPIEIIDDNAFGNNTSLEEIRLPATVKSIGFLSFCGCTHLQKVVSLAQTPPEFTFEISELNAFSPGTLSEAVCYVPENALRQYLVADEWRRFVEIKPLSEEKPTAVIDTITIGDFVFEINLSERFAKVIQYNRNVFDGTENVVIPGSIDFKNISYPVEAIGFGTFAGHHYNSLTMPASIRRIGISSFTELNIKTELKIPDGVTVIPESALSSLVATKLILPESLERLGEYAISMSDYHEHLADCLAEIECHNPEPPFAFENSFSNSRFEKSILKVPFGAKKWYCRHDIWSKFHNIQNYGNQQETALNHDLAISAELSGRNTLHRGMPLRAVGKIYNLGSQPVNGFKIEWSFDGMASSRQSFDVTLQPGAMHSFDILIPVELPDGAHKLILFASIIEPGADEDESDNSVSLDFTTLAEGYYRVSLLEQFTSEKCGNSPYSSSIAADAIKATNNTDFTVHLFNHCGYYDDFLTVNHDYEWFYNDGGATYTPAIMINRSGDEYTGWYTPVTKIDNTTIRTRLKEANNEACNAMVSVFCDIENNKASVWVALEKNDDFDMTADFDYVTVMLIEDSIKAQHQVDIWSDDYLNNYYHRNVLRKILTSSWGERVKWDGDRCLYKFETELNQSWNYENISAVAFIHQYNPQDPVNCRVYTAGASHLPQYRTKPDESDNWYCWNSDRPSSVTLNRSEVTLRVGEFVTLTSCVKPENSEFFFKKYLNFLRLGFGLGRTATLDGC